MTEKPTTVKGHHIAVKCLTYLRNQFRRSLHRTTNARPPEAANWKQQLSNWLNEYGVCVDNYCSAYQHIGDVAQSAETGQGRGLDDACERMKSAGMRFVALYESMKAARFNWRYDQGRILLSREVARMLNMLIEHINQYAQAVHHPEQFKPGEKVTLTLKLNTGPDMEDFHAWVASFKKDDAHEAVPRVPVHERDSGNEFITGLLVGGLSVAAMGGGCEGELP